MSNAELTKLFDIFFKCSKGLDFLWNIKIYYSPYHQIVTFFIGFLDVLGPKRNIPSNQTQQQYLN